MPKRKLTPHQLAADARRNNDLRDRVRELHSKKYSLRAMAEELGVSKTRVAQVRDELKLRAHPRKSLAKMATKKDAA